MPSNGKSDPFDASAGQLKADTFFDGKLQIFQMRRGYRFSIDAVLLAAAAVPKAGQAVVDLGTGCGIIPLMLSLRYPESRFFAVELQPELAELARMNVRANRREDRITVLQTDMRQLTQKTFGGPVDGIVSNPPYRRIDSGRVNPHDQKAIARHEIHLTLADLLRSAGRLLRTGGWLTVIYPAERLVDLFARMRAERIEPKWLATIHSFYGDPARLVITKGVKAGRPGITIHDPIVIYRPDGCYTPTVQTMMTLQNSVDTTGLKSY
jgi:tRNA1Val (adenine37-N6)-methyltransferase